MGSERDRRASRSISKRKETGSPIREVDDETRKAYKNMTDAERAAMDECCRTSNKIFKELLDKKRREGE